MTNNQISSLDCVYCSYTNFTLCIYSDSGRAKETRKFNSKITQPTPQVPLVLMQTGSNSEGDSLGWQMDLENLMLGPDGQLCDACERPQQFLYSPSEAAANTFHLHDNTKDDLPAALQVDVNMTRPKQIIKQITHRNPLEIFEEQKLAAKNKAASTSKKNNSASNKHIPQETTNAFVKFGLQMDHLKLPQFRAKDKDATMPGKPVDMESIKNIHVSKKHSRQHQKDA